MQVIGDSLRSDLSDSKANILDVNAKVTELLRSADIDSTQFGAPLAGSLIPWIDVPVASGQTKEEWKAGVEGIKYYPSIETYLLMVHVSELAL